MLLLLIALNLVLGSKKSPSLVGVKNCSTPYWIIFFSFIFICFLFTWLAFHINKTEQDLKIKYGNVNVAPSDVIFNRKNVISLFCLGFFGGCLSSSLGLGGGVIFNPVLLLLGMPPYVVSATGLYMVTFAKIASTVVYVIYG